jgi:hypothetical protein
METLRVLAQVPRRDIAWLCSLIAGYEGVAIVRTVDPVQGLVELLVAPAFHSAALTLLQALAQEMEIRVVEVRTPPAPDVGPAQREDISVSGEDSSRA